MKFPQGKIALKLLKKQLGFRYLMDVIPLDASLVRGSHGHITTSPAESPVFITHQTHLIDQNLIQATDVCSLILKHLNISENNVRS